MNIDGFYYAELGRWAGKGPMPPIVWERLDERQRETVVRGRRLANKLALHSIMRIVGIWTLVTTVGILFFDYIVVGLASLVLGFRVLDLMRKAYMVPRPPTDRANLRWLSEKKRLLSKLNGGEISEVKQ